MRPPSTRGASRPSARRRPPTTRSPRPRCRRPPRGRRGCLLSSRRPGGVRGRDRLASVERPDGHARELERRVLGEETDERPEVAASHGRVERLQVPLEERGRRLTHRSRYPPVAGRAVDYAAPCRRRSTATPPPGSRSPPLTRWSTACARRWSRPGRRASGRSPASTRSMASGFAASMDSIDEADRRAPTRIARAWRRHGRALHQRRDHDRRRSLFLLDYVAAARIDLEQWVA